MLAFVFSPVAACRSQLSVLDGVRTRHPDISFAAVAVRADAATARTLARNVKLPVAFDHDGAVANEYGVVVCPTITYVHQGGRVAGSTVGPQSASAIEQWVSEDPLIELGAVAPELAAELPGLGLAWCALVVAGDPLRRSPPALRERLRGLSDRHRGAQAIALRTRSIPSAYRVLFRHLGIEPDVDRIPVEAYMLERLQRGAYPSRGLLPDALMIATVETEVGVYALDADRVVGPLRLRVVNGRVEVADETGRLCAPFAAARVGHERDPPPAALRADRDRRPGHRVRGGALDRRGPAHRLAAACRATRARVPQCGSHQTWPLR